MVKFEYPILCQSFVVKDINKWLDDTPRFSEYSSASNSPSQLPLVEDCDGVAARIEHECRARLKMRPRDKVVI